MRIQTAVLLLLLPVITYGSVNFRVNTDFFASGDYSVSVNNKTWLRNAQTFFRGNDKWLSFRDKNLKVQKYETGQGTDSFGDFTFHKTTLVSNESLGFETWIRDYTATPGHHYVTFDQVYLNDTTRMMVDDCKNETLPHHNGSMLCFNTTISAFPSFNVENQHDVTLGYLTFAGSMIGGIGKKLGLWGNQTSKLPDGMKSGPLLLFDEVGNTVLISPLTQFMTSSMWHHSYPGGRVNWGTMGGVNEVPAGFTMRTFVVFEQGINQAFDTLGRILKSHYVKDNEKQNFKATDKTLTHLGYWTENGAQYYYHRETNHRTEYNITYDQTLIDVAKYANNSHIPYRYIEIDSWWYYDGLMDGVKDWRYRWDVFPGGGPKYVSQMTDMPLAAQNKYWATDNVYSKVNGGQFHFVDEDLLSLPDDPAFWAHLLGTAKDWGVIMYKQDLLNIQTLYTLGLQMDINLGERWLQQMNDAAQNLSMSIQYSNALPRHALQSLSYPTVTQARVSEDYHTNPDQWKIGVTSIFADAVGLAPFKGTFWTTVNETDTDYLEPAYMNVTEPYPALQSVVATLSGGPVGPGDMLEKTNRDVLLRCCNDDGLILKADRPAKAIDQQIIKHAIPSASGPKGEIWTTWTSIPRQSSVDLTYYGILFAADLDGEFDVYPSMAGFPYSITQYTMVFSFRNVYNISKFDDEHPLHLNDCTREEFCLYYFSNIFLMNGTNIGLLGELNKWVPVSPQRITRIVQNPVSLRIYVKGAAFEEVTLFFWKDGSLTNITCDLGQAGNIVMDTAIMGCEPTTSDNTSKPRNTTKKTGKHEPRKRQYSENDTRV